MDKLPKGGSKCQLEDFVNWHFLIQKQFWGLTGFKTEVKMRSDYHKKGNLHNKTITRSSPCGSKNFQSGS